MAACPACNHDVTTPFFLNLDAWRHLVCPHCQARLEMKPPRSIVFGSLIAPLFVLARQGHVFEVIAVVFMFATIFLLLLESVRPKLRLRFFASPTQFLDCNRDRGGGRSPSWRFGIEKRMWFSSSRKTSQRTWRARSPRP
jgi:hypothetical protein